MNALSMPLSRAAEVVALTVIAFLPVHGAFAQNILVNGDFETNPPATSCGNTIPWPISPWVLGTGNQANVVTVDGGVNCNYGNNGPQSDASGAAPGKKQHYLDIANGSNDFYQSFTPRCSGTVQFGGSFSTRSDFTLVQNRFDFRLSKRKALL
jgi:hypothetical protein